MTEDILEKSIFIKTYDCAWLTFPDEGMEDIEGLDPDVNVSLSTLKENIKQAFNLEDVYLNAIKSDDDDEGYFFVDFFTSTFNHEEALITVKCQLNFDIIF